MDDDIDENKDSYYHHEVYTIAPSPRDPWLGDVPPEREGDDGGQPLGVGGIGEVGAAAHVGDQVGWVEAALRAMRRTRRGRDAPANIVVCVVAWLRGCVVAWLRVEARRSGGGVEAALRAKSRARRGRHLRIFLSAWSRGCVVVWLWLCSRVVAWLCVVCCALYASAVWRHVPRVCARFCFGLRRRAGGRDRRLEQGGAVVGTGSVTTLVA